MCFFWRFGKVELAKTKVNLAKYQSIWHTRLFFAFSWCRLGVRARETWSACETRSRLHAHLMHSLAASQPISQHSSRLLRAPSNALSLQLCAHGTQHCGDMCVYVCVCEWSRCVWSKLRIRLLICWFGFFPHIQIVFRFEVMGFFRDDPICILLLSSLAAIDQAGQILDCWSSGKLYNCILQLKFRINLHLACSCWDCEERSKICEDEANTLVHRKFWYWECGAEVEGEFCVVEPLVGKVRAL